MGVTLLKPNLKKRPLYEMLREIVVLEKETTAKRFAFVQKYADAILDWEGLLSVPIEGVDQEFIEAAMKPAIEEIAKGFDAMIAKMDNLIDEAIKEKEKKQ